MDEDEEEEGDDKMGGFDLSQLQNFAVRCCSGTAECLKALARLQDVSCWSRQRVRVCSPWPQLFAASTGCCRLWRLLCLMQLDPVVLGAARMHGVSPRCTLLHRNFPELCWRPGRHGRHGRHGLWRRPLR